SIRRCLIPQRSRCCRSSAQSHGGGAYSNLVRSSKPNWFPSVYMVDALSRRRARLPVLAGRAPESPRRCRPATLNYSTPPPFGCAFASDTGLWGPCCARFPGVRGPLRPGGGPLVFGWLHRSRHELREGHRRGGQTTRGDGRHGGPEAAYPLSSGTVNEAAW